MSIVIVRNTKLLKLLNVSLTARNRTLCISSTNFTNANSSVVIDKDSAVRHVVMNNSKTRNALSIQMMENLIDSIETGQDNPHLRCIVISAEGKVFSAGHDLKELVGQAGREIHEKVFKTSTKLMQTIIKCPVPVIAKVDGVAAAAGCQLVAACDLAIASESSKFSTPGANFGIFCSTPGVALARIAPRKNAMYMLLTGLPITATEALRIGLVNTVVPSKNLDTEIDKITDAISSKSRDIISLGKKFFYEQIEMKMMAAYENGEKVMVDNINMEDGQEGIKSFVEKRKPIWKRLGRFGIELPTGI